MPDENSKPLYEKAVVDHYRCPDGILDFEINRELSGPAGFFKCGSGTTCYGRSSSGVAASPEMQLTDALADASASSARVQLPFDPDEVIANLRLERYSRTGRSAYDQVLKHIYYSVRPFTTRSFRRRIQKLRASDWQEESFPRWPVDTSVENLCEQLLALALRARDAAGIPFVWFWPNRASGCVLMTHDVETEAGREHTLAVLDLDDSFGIKASVQIVPEDRYEVSAELLDRIRFGGHEVCVQDLNHDGRLFDNRQQFRRRAKLINRYGREYGARGFRAAVLYRRPDWFEDLEFSFDMSIPNVGRFDPQRGGCCTVMPYFVGDLLEIPVTTIQDYMLFHLLGERSIDLWKTQVELILAKHGMASFIVHPDYILEEDTHEVYRNLLAWLKQERATRNLWFALPGEVDTWWRARQKMNVVKQGDSWRVEGAGSEGATLAFAQLENGRLVYRLAPGANQATRPATVV